MAYVILVCEPHASPPCLSWVDSARGVLDRRLLLHDLAPSAALASDLWLAAAETLISRQYQPPGGVVVVSWAWLGVDSDAAVYAQDRAVAELLGRKFNVSAQVVDESWARALGVGCYGVGADLVDQLHVGIGVRAAGLRLSGRWRMGDDGRPWAVDGMVIDGVGPVHGGRGWVRDWTWPDVLLAAAQCLSFEDRNESGTLVDSQALDSSQALDASQALDSTLPVHQWLTETTFGTPFAADVLSRAGVALGVALGGALNVFDVADIVLHVPSVAMGRLVMPAIIGALAEHSFASLRHGVTWHVPTLGQQAVALGAAQAAAQATVRSTPKTHGARISG